MALFNMLINNYYRPTLFFLIYLIKLLANIDNNVYLGYDKLQPFMD